jgi:hypothetical protein
MSVPVAVVAMMTMVTVMAVAVMPAVTMPAMMAAVSATTVMATMSAVMAALAATAAVLRGGNCARRTERKCYRGHDDERQDGLLQTVHGILPNEKRCLLL